MLQVAASPATLTTDQNTPITFQPNVQTSLADTYNLTANAPPGWTVTIDDSGNVTATPAPGLQGGTYPIQVIAQSSTDPNLVAQTTVEVTITPTQPGMTFAVNPDPLFTVPYDGAQVPTAFRAVIDNTGPAADTYNLSFANVPSGFTLVSSATSVTVPAGQTGIVGIYLIPIAGSVLPAPGTPLSFQVTATSTTNPAITQTVTESFTMPAIDAVTIVSNPVQVSTVPGLPATATVTLENVGNVAASAALTFSTDTGLTLTGLSATPITLAIGQTATETVAAHSRRRRSAQHDCSRPRSTSAPPSAAKRGVGRQRDPELVLRGSRADGHRLRGRAQRGDRNGAGRGFLHGPERLGQRGLHLDRGAADAVGPDQRGDGQPRQPRHQRPCPRSVHHPGQHRRQQRQPHSRGHGHGQPGHRRAGDGQPGGQLRRPVARDQHRYQHADRGQPNRSWAACRPTARRPASPLNGNLAYVANTQDIAVVNVSDPTNPQVVTTFGSTDINQGGLNLVQLDGNNLVVASENISDSTSFNLLVYSLTNPSSPQLLSNTTIPYAFPSDLVVQGNTAFIPIEGTSNDGNGNITDQSGDFLAVDLSNPAAPQLAGVLFNNLGAPEGSDSNQFDAVPINSQVTYVAGSTSTGANTQSGSGSVLVVNTANPASMSVTDHVGHPRDRAGPGHRREWQRGPGRRQHRRLAEPVQRPRKSGLTGNVTLTMLNISNPLDPTIIGSTVVTQDTLPNAGDNAAGKLQAIYLGNGQFAVSDTLAGGAPVLLVVNASDPSNLVTNTVAAPADINGMAVSGDRLLATSGAGLEIYQTGALTTQSVTAEVTVPTTGAAAVVPNSFSVQPNQIIPGSGTETLEWDLTLAPGAAAQQITWETTVNGPGGRSSRRGCHGREYPGWQRAIHIARVERRRGSRDPNHRNPGGGRRPGRGGDRQRRRRRGADRQYQPGRTSSTISAPR